MRAVTVKEVMWCWTCNKVMEHEVSNHPGSAGGWVTIVCKACRATQVEQLWKDGTIRDSLRGQIVQDDVTVAFAVIATAVAGHVIVRPAGAVPVRVTEPAKLRVLVRETPTETPVGPTLRLAPVALIVKIGRASCREGA